MRLCREPLPHLVDRADAVLYAELDGIRQRRVEEEKGARNGAVGRLWDFLEGEKACTEHIVQLGARLIHRHHCNLCDLFMREGEHASAEVSDQRVRQAKSTFG